MNLIKPLYRQSCNKEGKDAYQAKDYALATTLFKETLKYDCPDKDRDLVLYNLGCSLLQNKEYAEAISTLDSCLERRKALLARMPVPMLTTDKLRELIIKTENKLTEARKSYQSNQLANNKTDLSVKPV